jgi:hypothetical protein
MSTAAEVTQSHAYERIRDFYGDRKAQRSGVPLINHINEGLEILRRRHQSLVVQEAYCLHPLFQADDDLRTTGLMVSVEFDPVVIMLVMEYRSVANAFLSDQVAEGPDAWGKVDLYAKRPLQLSPLQSVNEMLVADKVQNRKDFLAHHLASHPRSRELDWYFKHWLRSLKVSDDEYTRLIEDL